VNFNQVFPRPELSSGEVPVTLVQFLEAGAAADGADPALGCHLHTEQWSGPGRGLSPQLAPLQLGCREWAGSLSAPQKGSVRPKPWLCALPALGGARALRCWQLRSARCCRLWAVGPSLVGPSVGLPTAAQAWGDPCLRLRGRRSSHRRGW